MSLIITESKSAFKIAFLMFDKDDNGRIDKDEFLLVREQFITSNRELSV